MADNTQVGAGTGDVVRDKDRSGVKTQIVGLDLGIGTGTENLMSGLMPVTGGSATAGAAGASFTFTAADVAVAAPDGTGTLISGTPTSGSVTPGLAVPDGQVASTFLIKGLTTSQTTITIYFEGSANSTTGADGDWVELKQRRTGTQPGVETADYKTQSNGYFRGNCAGFKWLRARLIGTFTGTPSAQMWTSAGQGATFFNSGIPGGSSTIGNVGLVAGSAAVGSVSVSNFPGTQPVSLATAPTTPVTGTFWQATQPVSLATAPTTPVTGTFWQTTQPVSLAGSGGIATTSGTLSAAVGNTPGTGVTASTTAQIVASVSTAGNVTFHLVTSAFVGTVVFEGSVDGGLNYGPIMSIREDGTGSENTTAISTAAAFIRQYTAALPGLAYFRVRCSAFTSGTVAVLIAPGPFLIEPNPSLAASSATIGTVLQSLAPTATTGAATGNIFSARAAVTTATTAAFTGLAAPAAGLSLYITDVSVSNAGATLCTVSLLPAAGTSFLDIVAAASGGGGSMNFHTPVKLAAATNLNYTTSAASTTVYVTVVGYTAP